MYGTTRPLRNAACLIALFFALTGCDTPPFSIVILPDTQHYTQTNHKYDDLYEEFDAYSEQMRWILENRVDKNILFVAHVGDVIEGNQDRDAQYLMASKAHALLEEDAYPLPYSITTGNHDLPDIGGTLSRDGSAFNRHFGPSRFSGKPWYGGPRLPGKNESNYTLFDYGDNLEFVIISLEHAPTKDALCWADAILADPAMQNRRAIIATHCHLNDRGCIPGRRREP